jgi:competence protein ComEC
MVVFMLHNQKPVFYSDATFQATVLETPQEKNASFKSVLHILFVMKNDSFIGTNEKMLVYFEKGEDSKKLQPGDNIVFNGSPKTIQNAGNPYEFDYKKYLERRKIFRQLYLPAEEWKKINTKASFSLIIVAEQFRDRLLDIYRAQGLGEDQFKILSALTLGYKRNLDPEIKTVFSSSGAMHVLAVSGLHVGIIYGVFLFLLGFLKQRKTGKVFFVAITLFCLWAYAFVTGLSPSVERAATMFSLLVIGESLKRRINIYNSLAASALLLLLINPNNLFEVGFQLSYAAVFGIVFLQPRIAKLLIIKNKVIRFFWLLLTVSIAAQITTFPLTLYYFNQFPTYFWLTNLLVIPAVSILIPLGLALLFFAKIPFLSTIISTLANQLIYIIYFILKKIERFPFSVFHESVQPVELIFIVGLLLSILFLFQKPQIKYIKAGLICVLLLVASSTIIKVRQINSREIIVYNNPENTILQLINGKENFVLSEKQIAENDYAKNLLIQTTEKLHLKNPVYITLADTLKNRHILSESGIVIFGNKTILFKQQLKSVPESYPVDYIINPISLNLDDWRNTNNPLIILNKSYIPKNIIPPNRTYVVSHEGAFKKKW